MIILSSDELEILAYIKSWNGRFVSIVDICRSASGRQRFKDTPNWAGPLMARLIDAGMVEVNERGHYRVVGESKNVGPAVIGDDYFPAAELPKPVAEEPPAPKEIPKHKHWTSPRNGNSRDKSGKKGPRIGRIS